MAFNPKVLNFYRTDSNAIFNIVFASLYDNIISKPIPYFSVKTRWKKLLKLRLKFELVMDPILDLEIRALPEISYTRGIWTGIFVNLKKSCPLKGDSINL